MTKKLILWLIPKSHILAKKVDFLNFFIHFGHFEGLADWKGKKLIKWKSCASSIPIWSVASVFSFSVRKGFKMAAEDIQNVKKLTKKVGKNSVHVFTRCACTRARAKLRAYLICLGDKSFHFGEGLVRIRGHLAEPQSDEKM